MIKFFVVILALYLAQGIHAGKTHTTTTTTTEKPRPKPPVPSKCVGENEEFQIEASGCEPTCDKPNRHVYCKLPCKSACVCKHGFVRNENNKCVRLVECPNFKGCAKNEVWHTCGPVLEGSCDNPKPGVCGGACRQGCYCYAGYVRNSNGTCIKIEDCPKKCNSETEVYENCGCGCEPTCNSPFPAVCTSPNQPKCLCKPGYMRLKEGGPCVKTCPKRCNDDNEIWTCGSACEGTCSNPNPKYCAEKAKEGCFCKPGYVRDDRGKCIEVKSCKKVCPKGEIHMLAPSCEPSCVDPFPARCTSTREGCHCRPGLFRNEKKVCVPYEQCKKRCTGHHEIWWNSAPACPATCDNPHPKRCTRPSKPGCYCKMGYVRNEQGECVDKRECQQRCSDANEVWETQYLNCELTCSNPNPTAQCGGPVRSGCFCRAGYVRNAEGKCILREKCPPKCTGGRIYQTCGPIRQPTCQDPNPQCSVECVSGCFCPPGHVLESGNCIPKEHCKKECSEGEIKVYCGIACDRTCENPDITTCTASCTPRCLCAADKFRNKDGRCVSLSQCEPRCDLNEEWKDCGPMCRPVCNATKEEHTRCQSIINQVSNGCRRGCFCKKGYILNNVGKCIPERDCNNNVPPPKNESYQEDTDDFTDSFDMSEA